MPVELTLLGWSIVVGLVHVVFALLLATPQRGMRWNTSNREGEPKPLTGMAARADRASRNFLETFVFFAAAVLAVIVAQRSTASTILGAQLYFWARVVYLPVYAIGIPYLRTLVWTVSVVGIVLVLCALF
jgi:uncharacterized MAPEG superfamily protein